MASQHENADHAPAGRRSATAVLRRIAGQRGVAPFIALACWFSAAGCSQQEQEINAFIHAWEASVSSPDYLVQPPDSLEIRSPTAPEMDEQTQVVRSDGKITLPLVGDVKVAGLTPPEIARKVESLLSKYYVDPQVSVRPSGQQSKRYYVFGEVTQPGAFPHTGRDTLLHALSQAQPTFVAWRANIKVIHPSHEEAQRRVLTIDAQKMMEQGRLEQNVLLEEGDIVYVPPTPMAWLALRMREVLWPFAPVAQTARSPYDAASNIASTNVDGFIAR